MHGYAKSGMSAAHILVQLTQQASAYMRVPYMFLGVPVEDKSLPQPEECEHPLMSLWWRSWLVPLSMMVCTWSLALSLTVPSMTRDMAG